MYSTFTDLQVFFSNFKQLFYLIPKIAEYLNQKSSLRNNLWTN